MVKVCFGNLVGVRHLQGGKGLDCPCVPDKDLQRGKSGYSLGKVCGLHNMPLVWAEI